MRKGQVPCSILQPCPPTSKAFLHLLSGNPLSRLLPHSHPRSPQAPPPARVGAQQFKLFLAKPHPPGDASGGEAAPAPPGAAGGKRLKPELPGPCQAGGRTETGPFRSTGLSPSGSWGCGLDAKSGRVSVCPSQPPRPPTLSLPAPGPAIPAYSEGGNPGQPLSPLSRPLSRAPGGWGAALFPGRIGGGGRREGPQCCLPGLLAASDLVPGGLLSQTETTGQALVGAWLEWVPGASPQPSSR